MFSGLMKKSKSKYLYDTRSRKEPNGKEFLNCMEPLFSCGSSGSDTNINITLVN